MLFWIFMLTMDFLIPITMLVLGKRFMKHPPAEINVLYGYRTSMSMKNRETWEFAHQYCGRIWHICGWVMLPATAVFLLPVMGKSEDCVGTAGGILCVVQILLLAGSIFPTEAALRKRFDRNGKRKYTPRQRMRGRG